MGRRKSSPLPAESLASDLVLARQRAAILQALANPARLRIVAWLRSRGEATVGELARVLDLPQSTASRQLGFLRLQALVQARQDGGYRYYSLAMPELADLVDCLAGCRRQFPEQ